MDNRGVLAVHTQRQRKGGPVILTAVIVVIVVVVVVLGWAMLVMASDADDELERERARRDHPTGRDLRSPYDRAADERRERDGA